jgi:hypothetical protein
MDIVAKGNIISHHELHTPEHDEKLLIPHLACGEGLGEGSYFQVRLALKIVPGVRQGKRFFVLFSFPFFR